MGFSVQIRYKVHLMLSLQDRQQGTQDGLQNVQVITAINSAKWQTAACLGWVPAVEAHPAPPACPNGELCSCLVPPQLCLPPSLHSQHLLSSMCWKARNELLSKRPEEVQRLRWVHLLWGMEKPNALALLWVPSYPASHRSSQGCGLVQFVHTACVSSRFCCHVNCCSFHTGAILPYWVLEDVFR